MANSENEEDWQDFVSETIDPHGAHVYGVVARFLGAEDGEIMSTGDATPNLPELFLWGEFEHDSVDDEELESEEREGERPEDQDPESEEPEGESEKGEEGEEDSDDEDQSEDVAAHSMMSTGTGSPSGSQPGSSVNPKLENIIKIKQRLQCDILEVLDSRLVPKRKVLGQWVLRPVEEWDKHLVKAYTTLLWLNVKMKEVKDHLKRIGRERRAKQGLHGLLYDVATVDDVHQATSEFRKMGRQAFVVTETPRAPDAGMLLGAG